MKMEKVLNLLFSLPLMTFVFNPDKHKLLDFLSEYKCNSLNISFDVNYSPH